MRLPPQRRLASRLGLDFTTIARGYVEAQKRGLVESTVGQGTFVKASKPAVTNPMRRRTEVVDHTMNLPPEPTDPVLIDRMQAGLTEVAHDLISLLRYQGFGGSEADKEAASSWLGRRAMVPSQERIFVTPGAHPALLGIDGPGAAGRYDPDGEYDLSGYSLPCCPDGTVDRGPAHG